MTTNPVFAKRRKALEKLVPGSAFLLPSGRDGHLSRFRAQSHFYYFTGFNEPEAYALLRPGHAEPFILFLRSKDPTAEMWDGLRLGVDGACDQLSCDQSFSQSELEKQLPKLLSGCDRVYYQLGEEGDLDKTLINVLEQTKRLDRRAGKGRLPIFDPNEALGEMRVIKSPEEINWMRKSAEISIFGHQRAMAHTQPGMNEIQIYSHLVGGFYSQLADREGYSAIVASGDNATVLHYRENSRDLRDGELLLIDAGAEKDFYTADITRTFPVNGRFSSEQKDVYQATLEVQEELIALVTTEMSLPELQEVTCRKISQKLIDLGICQGSVDEVVENKDYMAYYPHGVGHYLGMDVHDLGKAKINDKPRKLEPGMVITVEPGIYIPSSDEKVAKGLRGIGVRIEDDILVTNSEPENLTGALIKSVKDLESFVGSAN